MSDNQYKEKGERLKKIREILLGAEKTLVKFAEDMGMPYANYSRIENGYRDIPTSLLEKLSNVSKGNMMVNINYLLNGVGEPFIINNTYELLNLTIQKPNVTLYNIDASAGGLIAAQNDKGSPLEQWAIPELNGEHIAVNVQGNSMSPTMDHGDKIIAKECYRNDLRDGQIYIVVSTDNNVRVKRLRMANEVLMLWADNVAFDPRYERLHLHEVIKMFHVVMVCKVL